MTDLRRQSALFDSAKLRQASVAVIGSGTVSNFLCAYLAGLGVGRLVLVDNSTHTIGGKEFLVGLAPGKGNKVDRMAQTLRQINDDMTVLPYFSIPNQVFIQGCGVVVDTTNSPESKYRMFRHCEGTDMQFISCSGTEAAGSVTVHAGGGSDARLEDITLEEFRHAPQGSFTSGIVAAVAADEIRKKVCPVETDKPLEHTINYSLLAKERFVPELRWQDIHLGRLVSIRAMGKKALVVGAGGIGTYILLNLAMHGFQIDLYDGDIVEEHNLNRQVIHFGAVGSNKASTAAKKLSCIGARVRGHPEFLTERILEDKRRSGERYDVVFSCVDSWAARRMLNSYCRLEKIPLFNGSVSTFGCAAEYSIPGQTHCLECSNDYRRRAREERPTSCADLPANVVMPNAIAGALMVAESMRLFSPDIVMRGVSKTRYDSNFAKRFIPERTSLYCASERYYKHNCRCHTYLDGGGKLAA